MGKNRGFSDIVNFWGYGLGLRSRRAKFNLSLRGAGGIKFVVAPSKGPVVSHLKVAILHTLPLRALRLLLSLIHEGIVAAFAASVLRLQPVSRVKRRGHRGTQREIGGRFSGSLAVPKTTVTCPLRTLQELAMTRSTLRSMDSSNFTAPGLEAQVSLGSNDR